MVSKLRHFDTSGQKLINKDTQGLSQANLEVAGSSTQLQAAT